MLVKAAGKYMSRTTKPTGVNAKALTVAADRTAGLIVFYGAKIPRQNHFAILYARSTSASARSHKTSELQLGAPRLSDDTRISASFRREMIIRLGANYDFGGGSKRREERERRLAVETCNNNSKSTIKVYKSSKRPDSG